MKVWYLQKPIEDEHMFIGAGQMMMDDPYDKNAIIRDAYQNIYGSEMPTSLSTRGVVLLLSTSMIGKAASSHLTMTTGDVGAAYFGGRTKKEPFSAARAAVNYAQVIVQRKVDEDGWTKIWETGETLPTEFKHAKFQLLAPAWFERWNGRPTKLAVAFPISDNNPTSYWLAGVSGIAGGHWQAAYGLKGGQVSQHQSCEAARGVVKSAIWNHALGARLPGSHANPVWMLPGSFTGRGFTKGTIEGGLWDTVISPNPPEDLGRCLNASHWLVSMLKNQNTSDPFSATDPVIAIPKPKLFFFQGRRFGLLLRKPGRTKKVK